MVDAFSMRWFLPTPAVPTGHDEFFAAFEKFGTVSGSQFVDMTVDQLNLYDSQNVQYVEFMVSSWCPNDRERFVKAVSETTDDASKLAALEASGLGDCVARNTQRRDGLDRQDNDRARVRCAQRATGLRRHLPLHSPDQPQQFPRRGVRSDRHRGRADPRRPAHRRAQFSSGPTTISWRAATTRDICRSSAFSPTTCRSRCTRANCGSGLFRHPTLPSTS